MNDSPHVSVIIPCYKHAHFLCGAIESALAQTYKNVEVVVVDDGSPDETAQVAAQYPVRYVRQENRGLSAARNTGIRECTGDFLVFLDADDRLLPNAIEAGVACFKKHPQCAFVSGDNRRVAPDGSQVATPERVLASENHYADFLRGNYIGMHATVMYRREPIVSAGGFDESLRACEDYDLYLRLARTFPTAQHDELVAEYVRHDANMSRDIGLMLPTVLTVLHRQWPHVKGDTELLGAYRDGFNAWKNYYADELIAEAKTHKNASARREMLRALVLLLRFAPGRFVSFMLRKIYRKLFAKKSAVPKIGAVNFGDLRRVEPISRRFGYERGTPIDRYYIENFLARNSTDIRGRVLEIGDNSYTLRFGGARVTQSDVLHVHDSTATFVGDLPTADHIPSNAFDCVVLTQTLHLIYDYRAALRTLHRILKPGSVLLATFPGISQLEDGEWAETWYWSFTTRAAKKMFGEFFRDVQTESHGNVLAATAFLQGIAAEELAQSELEYRDPLYETLVTVRAQKSD